MIRTMPLMLVWSTACTSDPSPKDSDPGPAPDDSGEPFVQEESCNGLDDDGDGQVDEDLEGTGLYLLEVPEYCSDEVLTGGSCGAEPESQRIALYIDVYGWWNKPTWSEPSVAIEDDGSWSAQIMTAASDVAAVEICAFLVPSSAELPQLEGADEIPESLYETALSWSCVERDPRPRKLEFGGYQWGVKSSCGQVAGPGPCIFVDDEASVRVESGSLHLVADSSEESPTCTEIVLEESLGFGEARFTVADSTEAMDPNAVLALFTYDPDPDWTHREIDVEIARWGDASNDNAQFVVQPHTTEGNIERFDLGSLAPTTHKIRWQSDRVLFRSLEGDEPYPAKDEEGLACWIYTGDDLPPEGAERIHINLWWMNGEPDSEGARETMEISAFEFVEASDLPADESCTQHP